MTGYINLDAFIFILKVGKKLKRLVLILLCSSGTKDACARLGLEFPGMTEPQEYHIHLTSTEKMAGKSCQARTHPLYSDNRWMRGEVKLLYGSGQNETLLTNQLNK